MPKTITGKGSCLCGAVRFFVPEMKNEVGVCHCDMCRKWTGGPLMSAFCGSEVTFEGEENITVYDSSPWAERGFCKKCGSGLFYRMKETKQYHIPMGIFENCDDMDFVLQVFIDKKPEYYSFADETETMTEAEVFAKYGPSSE